MTAHYVFFPFTHLTERQLQQISAFFPHVSYLPLQPEKEDPQYIKKGMEDGIAQRIVLPSNALDMARQRALQYTQWAKIHKGNERNLKAIIKDSAYFTSDTHVSAIKSQIKGKTVNEPEHSGGDLEKNMLFLTMAQMCDEQNEQIDLELKTVEKSREKLLAALRGPEDCAETISGESSLGKTDAGRIMTRERIASWAACMALSGSVNIDGENCFLITTSSAVMEYLEANCTDVINALDIDQIKVHENNCRMKTKWQHQFCESLMQAVHGEGIREKDLPEAADTCSVSGRVKVCIFSGDFINEVFKLSGKQVVVCLVNLNS